MPVFARNLRHNRRSHFGWQVAHQSIEMRPRANIWNTHFFGKSGYLWRGAFYPQQWHHPLTSLWRKWVCVDISPVVPTHPHARSSFGMHHPLPYWVTPTDTIARNSQPPTRTDHQHTTDHRHHRPTDTRHHQQRTPFSPILWIRICTLIYVCFRHL